MLGQLPAENRPFPSSQALQSRSSQASRASYSLANLESQGPAMGRSGRFRPSSQLCSSRFLSRCLLSCLPRYSLLRFPSSCSSHRVVERLLASVSHGSGPSRSISPSILLCPANASMACFHQPGAIPWLNAFGVVDHSAIDAILDQLAHLERVEGTSSTMHASGQIIARTARESQRS